MAVTLRAGRLPRPRHPLACVIAKWIGRAAYGLGRAAWELNHWGSGRRTNERKAVREWAAIVAAESPSSFYRPTPAVDAVSPVPARTWTVKEYAQGMSNDDWALLDEGRRIWKTL